MLQTYLAVSIVSSDPLLTYGQRRISPVFSANEGVPSYLYGRPLSEVAADLGSGILTADQLPIKAFRGAYGEIITINNRSLAALYMAKLKPTLIDFVNPTRQEVLRLGETPIIGSPIPGGIIPITPSKLNLQIIDVVTTPQ